MLMNKDPDPAFSNIVNKYTVEREREREKERERDRERERD